MTTQDQDEYYGQPPGSFEGPEGTATVWIPGSTQEAAPEPPEMTGKRLASLIARIREYLRKEGIVFETTQLDQISRSEKPWVALKGILTRQGFDSKFDELQGRLEEMDREVYRVNYLSDGGRISAGGIERDGGESYRYAQEWNRLVYEEGFDPNAAHDLMAERGWENPYYPDVPPELTDMAETLAIMKAAGVYTGPVTPDDVIRARTDVAAMEMIEDSYEGEIPWSEFQARFATEQVGGVGEDYATSASYGAQAEANAPTMPDIEEEDERGPALGVPKGFSLPVAGPPNLRPNSIGRPGYARSGYTELPRMSQQEPEYWDGDQYSVFVDNDGTALGYETIRLYQTLLYEAGWLSEEDYFEEDGYAGFATFDAMTMAMIQANRTTATNWIDAAKAAGELRKEKEDEEDKYKEPIPVYTPGVYLKPDPDYLRQIVKSAFRENLGREPTKEEIKRLVGGLATDYRAAFDEMEAKARAEFEQELAAREASFGPIDPETGERVPQPIGPGTGPPARPGGPTGGAYGVRPGGERVAQGKVVPGDTEEAMASGYRTVSAGYTGQNVDPITSFQERFEAAYANEMARNRYRQVSREAFNDVQASIMMMNQAIGGV